MHSCLNYRPIFPVQCWSSLYDFVSKRVTNFSLRLRVQNSSNTDPRSCWRTHGTRNSLLSPILFLLTDKRLYIVKYMCTYPHFWLRRNCIFVWITVATKKYSKWNIFTQIGNGAECWLDTSLGRRPGDDRANTWHWTERFKIFSNRT
jgi:hypothetical protein